MARKGRGGPVDCGVEAAGEGAQRRCAVCRKELDRDDSVRFVVGPDGVAAIDWSRKLPGRGASVCWSRQGLEAAGEGGALRRALGGDLRLPTEPGWPLAAATAETARRVRKFLGLAGAAGQVRSGAQVVLGALRSGQVVWLGLASDAGETVAGDWERKARGFEVSIERLPCTAEELGGCLSRQGPRSVIAAGHGALADSLRSELKRHSRLL